MATKVMKVTKDMLNQIAEEIPQISTEELSHLKFDLGNLTVFSSSDVDFQQAKVNDYLDDTARTHVQYLYTQLFNLPTEEAMGDTGRLIVLPNPTTILPREKPLPKEKPLTKWEAFAKQKGIIKKTKQGKVWDEEKEEWGHRYGRKRANNEMDQWAIDAKEGSEIGTIDPWTEMRQNKKARVDKNKKQQEANIRAATTGSRAAIPGGIDLSSVLGQQKPGKRNAMGKEKKGISHLQVALQVAQKSTNSMGKFDKLRKGEPVIKAAAKPRRDALLQNIGEEKKQHSSVMKRVLGRVSENEALNVNKAMSSIGASNIKAGEIVSAKKVMERRKSKATLESKLRVDKSKKKIANKLKPTQKQSTKGKKGKK